MTALDSWPKTIRLITILAVIAMTSSATVTAMIMVLAHHVPDSMLPGERALAEEYGVALGTIRRAMDELRDRGLVTTLAAKGTFVTRQG